MHFVHSSLRFALLVCVVPLSASAADWPRFRGPNGSAVSDSQGLPVKWDLGANLQWKTDLPGPGSSSPIVIGDKAYITCYSGYGVDRNSQGNQEALKRHLLCISLADGKIVWNTTVDAKTPEEAYRGFIADHGYATSTPVSDGERIYVLWGRTGVLAFNLAGKELWRTSVGTQTSQNGWGSGASPILYKNLVIVNAAAEGKAMFGLDKSTGKEVWKSPADNLHGSWSTPVLVDAPNGKTEMAVSAPYEVWGFDPETGDFLWFANGVEDRTICGSVVAKDGIVYAVGGRSGSAVAIRSGGRDDVTKTHTLWKGSLSAYVPSPVLAGDRIYCVSERGILGCLSTKDGKEIFTQRLSNAGGVYASPVVADGKVYIVTRTNGTFVLDANGKGETLSKNVFEDDSTDFNASPAIADGRILLRSNRRLYCVAGSASKVAGK